MVKDSEIKEPKTLPMEKDIDQFFKQIRKVIADTDGQCIFRGENTTHKLICSSLAQKYIDEIQTEHFSLADIQEKELKKIASYTELENQNDTLTEVRHYGGKVTLIDFSYDYNVALFFACDSRFKELKEDGRIIIVNTSKLPKDIKVIDPKRKLNIRITSQKSVLIHPLKRNYLYEKQEEEFITVIPISKELKQEIKKRLSEHHGIKTETIYKDIFGYIQNQRINQDADTFFYKGVSLEEREKHEEAIIAFTESITRSPSAAAYTNRGYAYNEQGNYDLAISDYTEAIRLDPNDVAAYTNRGVAYVKKEEYDLAISDCTEAIRLDPNESAAYTNRGYAYNEQGNYDLAISDYTEAIRLDPNHAAAYTNRGNTYDKQGKYDLAISDCTEAIRLDPNDAAVYNNRGDTYDKQDEYDFAILDYTEAIRLDPNDAAAYNIRALAKVKLTPPDTQGAIADIQTVLQLANAQGDTELAQQTQALLKKINP